MVIENIDCVLFDIDKTLLIGSHCHFYSFKEAFMDIFGVPVKVDIPKIQGMTDKEIIFRLAHENGFEISEGEFYQIVEKISFYYRKNLKRDNIKPIKGSKKVLKGLNRLGVPLGVVTGNIEDVAWLKLREAGFDHLFSFGGFGDEGCERSSILGIALERARMLYEDVRASRTILVGDTPRDMAAGAELGVITIGVASGDFSCGELESAGATYVLEGLSDVEGFFKIFSANNSPSALQDLW